MPELPRMPWTLISRKVPTRDEFQCANQWRRQLGVMKTATLTPMSHENDLKLIRKIQEMDYDDETEVDWRLVNPSQFPAASRDRFRTLCFRIPTWRHLEWIELLAKIEKHLTEVAEDTSDSDIDPLDQSKHLEQQSMRRVRRKLQKKNSERIDKLVTELRENFGSFSSKYTDINRSWFRTSEDVTSNFLANLSDDPEEPDETENTAEARDKRRREAKRAKKDKKRRKGGDETPQEDSSPRKKRKGTQENTGGSEAALGVESPEDFDVDVSSKVHAERKHKKHKEKAKKHKKDVSTM